MRVICWWFGCDPDYEKSSFGWPEEDGVYIVPCQRCKNHDTGYSDRVGDTRHNRLIDYLWSLIPTKKNINNDVPF